MAGKRSPEGTLARRMEILAMLPIHGLAVGLTPSQVTERLDSRQQSKYAVSLRTVQRDLEAIAGGKSEWRDVGVELIAEEDTSNSKVKRYSHTPKSKALLFHTPSVEDLTLLTLVEQELALLLPPSVASRISYYITQAKVTTHKQGSATASKFIDCLLVMPAGLHQLPPAIKTEHLQIITEALFRSEMLKLEYKTSFEREQVYEYRIHPIGLVKRGLHYYLYAARDEFLHKSNGTNPVRSFRVDRVVSAERLEHYAVDPSVPSLSALRASGQLAGNMPQGLISLKLRIANTENSHYTYLKFNDAPLSLDQTIVLEEDSSYTLTATVQRSKELDILLQGLLHHIVVLEPETLKNDLQRYVDRALAMQRAK